MHGLAGAMLMYAEFNNGWTHKAPNNGLWDTEWERLYYNDPSLPIVPYPANGGGVDPVGKYKENRSYWGIAYYKYAKNKDVWACPSQERVDDWPEDGLGLPYQEFFKHCSYGLNGLMVANKEGIDAGRKISQIKYASEAIFFQDHLEQRLDTIEQDFLCASYGTGKNLPQWYNTEHSKKYGFDVMNEVFRHLKKCSTAWLDGHVSDIRWTRGEGVKWQWYAGSQNLEDIWDLHGGGGH
jgi:prepilin-type processing-associated H-X9-DG protein